MSLLPQSSDGEMDIQEASRRLGEPIANFRPGVENMVAGFILGVLFMTGGLAAMGFPVKAVIISGANLPVSAEKGWSWTAVGLMTALGLAFTVVGVVLVCFARSLPSLRVVVCPQGFIYVERGQVRLFPWDQIREVKELALKEYLPLGAAKYVAPVGKSRNLFVCRTDGVEARLDKNRVNRMGQLVKIIEDEVGRRGKPWNVVPMP